MTQRYTYFQCGNCIDIRDTLTGQTVATLNCMDTPASDVFEQWLVTQRLPMTRKLELALLVVALIGGSLALPFFAAAFG